MNSISIKLTGNENSDKFELRPDTKEVFTNDNNCMHRMKHMATTSVIVAWSFELYLYLELTQVSDRCPPGRLVHWFYDNFKYIMKDFRKASNCPPRLPSKETGKFETYTKCEVLRIYLNILICARSFPTHNVSI